MIDVNYNEYKETIAQNMKLIVENHDLKEKIERLNNTINDINYFIEQRCNEGINDTEKAILHSIELISKGIIKVVRQENNGDDKNE